MNGPPIVTKTKSKTKTVVATLLIVAGLGVLFAMIWQKRLVASLRLTLPNLVIDSVTIEESTRIPTVIVRNAGTRATDNYFSIKFSWYDANGVQTATINLDRPGTTLAPGITDTYMTGGTADPTGSTSLTITVDFSTRVRESNEDDNVWTGRSFTKENAEPEFCTDGTDNEADGVTDMNDPDCVDVCGDNFDNNNVLGVDEGCMEPDNLLEIESGPPEDPIHACNNFDDDDDGQVDDGCDRDNDGFCRVEVAVVVFACHRTIPNNQATIDCRDNDVTSYPGSGC